MSNKLELDNDNRDRLAAAVRSITGFIPGFGNMVEELITAAIPNQRMDRMSDYIRVLNGKFRILDLDIDSVKAKLADFERLAIFEDGIVLASRAPTPDRREHIACVIAQGVSEAGFSYERSKKILNTIDALTDAEIIVLKSYGFRGEEHRDFVNRHSAVLRPASRTVGSSRRSTEGERAAFQDAWRNTLERLGLIATEPRGDQFKLMPFGRLVLSYLACDEPASPPT